MLRRIGYLVGIPTVVTYGYYLYKADGNFAKAEYFLIKDAKKVINGTPIIPEKVKNTQFKNTLHIETRKALGIYFLQLDLDKENGFRRSDAIDLLEKAGVDLSLYTKEVDEFYDSGVGRIKEKKKLSGCTLQELGTFLESLNVRDAIRASEKEGFNPAVHEAKSQDAPTELEEKIIAFLKKKQSKTSMMNLFAVPNKLSANAKETSQEEMNESLKEEMLKLDLERVKKSIGEFQVLSGRRELSEVEKERWNDLKTEKKSLEKELKQSKKGWW